jgi:hypothetical protein
LLRAHERDSAKKALGPNSDYANSSCDFFSMKAMCNLSL